MARFKASRGACSNNLPSIHGSPATQATSGRQGSWVMVSGSGITSTSELAGVWSSHVANPAKPAPAFCMRVAFSAGTSLARWVPNKSVKLKRKYFTPCFFAYASNSPAMVPLPQGFVICFVLVSVISVPRNPTGACQRHACHGGSFNRQGTEVFGFQIVHMGFTIGTRDGLRFQS